MNYEEFKNELQEKIQSNFLQQIDFISHIVNRTNETLDALTLRFAGQEVSCTIYPEQMYENYKNGVSISAIANDIAAAVSKNKYPDIPEITPENAAKSISFSLINAEKNEQLLKNCPYKEIHDMAAVPRWHISDDASFLVTDRIVQMLRMTKEEVLDIEQKNTEEQSYTCQSMKVAMREAMINEGMGEELISDLIPTPEIPFYVLSKQNRTDGSCAILSDRFMQQAAEQTGMDEMYLIPSSRHEMLAVNPEITGSATDARALKEMVMSVNSDAGIMRAEDFLSNSVYKYDAKTHSISMCDNNGLFHDKSAGLDGKNLKQAGHSSIQKNMNALENSGPVCRMAHRH